MITLRCMEVFLGRGMALLHLKRITGMKTAIACSHALKNQLNEYNKNIFCIQNGVDTDRFYPVDYDERARLRSSLGMPHNMKVIIVAAPLIKRKNVYEVLEACKQLKFSNKVFCYILGDGPEKGRLEQCAIGIHNVEFRGDVRNIEEYYQAADILISSSLSEGLPNTVLEASSCQLPVLLSNIESHKELIDKACLVGETYQIGNVEELVNKLNRMLNEDRMQKKANRELIAEEMGLRRMSIEYQNIYTAIMREDLCN